MSACQRLRGATAPSAAETIPGHLRDAAIVAGFVAVPRTICLIVDGTPIINPWWPCLRLVHFLLVVAAR
jgi:hypothetical protein